jgi:hypothetical protein
MTIDDVDADDGGGDDEGYGSIHETFEGTVLQNYLSKRAREEYQVKVNTRVEGEEEWTPGSNVSVDGLHAVDVVWARYLPPRVTRDLSACRVYSRSRR